MEYIIFVDGSFLEKTNFACCSILIFNHNKLVDKILVTNIDKMKSSIEVELLALKVALKHMIRMIQKLEIKKILIFSDCKSIVDVINTPKKNKTFIKLNSNLYHYVHSTNILLLNKEELNFRIEYLPRKFNIAHKYCTELLKKYKKSHKIEIM